MGNIKSMLTAKIIILHLYLSLLTTVNWTRRLKTVILKTTIIQNPKPLQSNLQPCATFHQNKYLLLLENPVEIWEIIPYLDS